MWYSNQSTKNGGSNGGVNDNELAPPVLASQQCMFPHRDKKGAIVVSDNQQQPPGGKAPAAPSPKPAAKPEAKNTKKDKDIKTGAARVVDGPVIPLTTNATDSTASPP